MWTAGLENGCPYLRESCEAAVKKVIRRARSRGSSPTSIDLPHRPLAAMKLFTVLVPFMALVTTMLACSVYAMPATPGAAIATLHGTLGAITNATAGILASGRAVDDQDAAIYAR